MRRARPWAAGPAALALVLAMSGRAAAATDLAIRPPAGFTVKQSSPDGDPVEGYEVTSTANPDAGCQITFHPAAIAQSRRQAQTAAAAATRGRSHPAATAQSRRQAQTDAAAATRGRRDAVAKRFAESLDVKSVSPLVLQGIDGVLVSADPKSGEGTMHALLALFDTSRGETEIDCVAFDDMFSKMRPRFEAVIRGVTLPK